MVASIAVGVMSTSPSGAHAFAFLSPAEVVAGAVGIGHALGFAAVDGVAVWDVVFDAPAEGDAIGVGGALGVGAAG